MIYIILGLLAILWVIALFVARNYEGISSSDRCEVLKKYYCQLRGLGGVELPGPHGMNKQCDCC